MKRPRTLALKGARLSPRGTHRAPDPEGRSLWKNPRIIVAMLLLLFLIASLGIEQATKGEYATPNIVGELLKIAIPAFFTAGGLSEVMRYLNRRERPQSKDPVDPPSIIKTRENDAE